VIQCRIGEDAAVWQCFLELSNAPLHESSGVVGLLGEQALLIAGNYREQGDSGNPKLVDFSRAFQEQIKTQALHSRHRWNGFPLLLALQHKHRIDEVCRAERVLSYQ